MSNIGLNLNDVGDIVDKLMAKQYIRYFQLKTAKSADQIQITALGSLQSLFTTFQGKMNNLTDAFNTIAYQASSSNSSVVNNTKVTNNSVGAGSHTVIVSQLAKAQQLNTQVVFSSKNTGLGINETLTFTNAADSNKHFAVEVKAGDSLENIKDKINNSSSNIGISASIVASTGGGGATEYNLILTSTEGTANQITISGDTGNKFQFNETTAAKNAEFTFDGYNEVRSSNFITDVIDGLSFSLAGTGTSVITTSQNDQNLSSIIQSAVTDMLASYNQIITFLDGNKYVTAKDDNSKQSTTNYNNSFNFIKSRLQGAVNTAFNASSDIRDLRTVGIVLSPSKEVVDQYDLDRTSTSIGSLMIDLKPQSKYNGATTMSGLLENDFGAVKDFFTNADSGFFANVNKVINNSILSEGDTGLIKVAIGSAEKAQNSIDAEMTKETKRLDLARETLTDQFAKLNGVISFYQSISDALEKQYAYLDNLIRGGK